MVKNLAFVITLTSFLFFGIDSYGQTRTSIASGNWGTKATWDCNCIPATTNDVVISNGTVVTQSANNTSNNLTIAWGGTLDNSGRRTIVNGNLILDGTHEGNGEIQINGTNTTISGIGTVNSSKIINVKNGNQTILSGTNLKLPKSDFQINDAFTITNLGTISISKKLTGKKNASTWVNGINATLNVSSEVLVTGILDASATGNTVNYDKTKDQDIKTPTGSQYYNLTASGSNTKTVLDPLNINGSLSILYSSIDLNGNDISVGGDFINTYGTFIDGVQTVTFNGSVDQTVSTTSPETFYDVVINKSGGNLILDNNIIVSNSLNMTAGNVVTDANKLTLGTSLLNLGNFLYSSGTIIGTFERWINTIATAYNFPVGTTSNNRNASITFNSLVGGTAALSFIETLPNNNGIPLFDSPDSIYNTFAEGYWDVSTGNGLSSSNYNINLTGNGFTSYTIDASTRVLTRPNDFSNWIANGSHTPATGVIASRNNITTLPAQLAFADTNSCFSFPLVSTITGSNSVCTSDVGITYSVTNNPGSIYNWTITGGTQASGGNTNSITVNWGVTGMIGGVSVQEYTGCAYGEVATYPVNIHTLPTSPITGTLSTAEGTIGEPYSVTNTSGYTYSWIITGGTQASGGNTNNITIDWGAAGTGSVSVVASSSCGDAPAQNINVAIYNTINSIASGTWKTTTTWDCNCVPTKSSNVIINNGHTVNSTAKIDVNSLIIDAGGIFDDGGNNVKISGDFKLDGTYIGSKDVEIKGSNNTISGTGSFAGHIAKIKFNGGFKTIAPTTVLSKLVGNIEIRANTVVRNEGNITFTGEIIGADAATSRWINASSSILNVNGIILTIGVFNASEIGNTVNFIGAAGQTIKIPSNSEYYNLTLSGTGSKLMISDLDINGSLTINSGLDIDATNNYTINVGVNWVNNGIFEKRNGIVILNGSSSQSILGNTTFNNITLNNASGATISSGIDSLIGSLTLSNGNFAANGGLILVSNSVGTARIAEITGGSISGNITMQRYINAGSTNWRFLTSPVSGTTIADWNDDFITSGFTGSDAPTFPFTSIYYYDETNTGTIDSGYVAATSVSNSIAPGQGVWVWSGDTIIGTQPFVIDVTGSANTGNINLPVSYTNTGIPTDDGWNMVGNPYASTIDWDSPSWNKSNINDAIYIWNPDQQQFASYVGGIGTNGGSKDIASSQAFWVQTSGSSPSLQATEACKNSIDVAFLKQKINPFRIKAQNSFGSDEIVIHSEPNSTNNFDGLYDAAKMTSISPSLPHISSIIYDSLEFSINQLPQQEIDIPVKILTGIAGFHTISVENVSNFANSSCLILEDIFTGSSYNLATTQSFTTYIYDTTTIARFLLHIGAPVNVSQSGISCSAEADASILYEKASSTSFDIIWKNEQGVTISNKTNVLQSDSLLNIASGVYYIETTDNTCGNTVDTITIVDPLPITALYTSSDTIYLTNGGSANFNNQSGNSTNYLWDFGDGSTSSVNSPTHQYTQGGSYNVSLTAYQNKNCSETYNKTIFVLTAPIKESTDAKAWIDNHVLFIDVNTISYDKIEVTNILGELVYSTNNEASTHRINLGNLSTGMFMVTVLSEENTTTIKVPYSK